MEYYVVLLPLALILILSKILINLCHKYGLPEVVGMLAAGLVIGAVKFIPNQTLLTDTSVEGIGFIAKIGVILIMFTAGLDINIRQIKSVGLPSVVVTFAGVIVPMAFGFIVATLFNGGFVGLTYEKFLTNLFYGVILTATSVSVTVATLREIGKLDSKIGITVVAAAILDDIIGVIVLSLVIALKGNGAGAASPLPVILKTVLFFVFAIVAGILISWLFKKIEEKFPHHRTLPILSVGICFLFAYISERIFGIADITGAFAAGLILSSNNESRYIERRSDIMSYMIFTPVFFASIGISTDFSGFNVNMLLFGLCFIVAGLLGKVVGCGGAALCFGYGKKDSLRVGVGMMARAEVALVCAGKGVEYGLADSAIMPFIVLLIIISSVVTPIILRASYRDELKAVHEGLKKMNIKQ